LDSKNKITFISKEGSIEKNIYCPVCASEQKSSLFAKVPHPSHSGFLSLFECSFCMSYIYEDIYRVGYLRIPPQEEKSGTMHYCLIGCGTEFGINILSRLYDKEAPKNLLEVGCGFGYNLSYWESFKKQEATGLEKAKYGLHGRKELNVNILPKYLDEIESKKVYDIVLSTEVIEHVEDPFLFLKQALLALKNNGILVFTTPSRDSVIKNKNNPAMLRAILSPGYHEFVISKEGIKNLLKKLGINNYKIEEDGNHFITYASKSKDVLTKVKHNADANEHHNFLKFLVENKTGIVQEGALYRFFKNLVNMGLYDEAQIYYAKILELLSQKYKLSINLLYKPEPHADDFIRQLPPYLGPFFYYAGILHSHRIEDLKDRCMFFSLAVNFLKSTIASAPKFSQEAESLLPEAEIQLVNVCRDIQVNHLHHNPHFENKNKNKNKNKNFVKNFKKLIKRFIG